MTANAANPRFCFEKMTEHHDVSSFDCQHTYLTSFLQEKAFAETSRDLSLTFVLLDEAVDPPSVIGYFTLRSDSYYPEERQGIDLVPVIELVALARDSSRRGQSIGDYLLIEVLRNVKAAADLVGIAGLHLLPTAEGWKLYDRYNFGEHPLSYRTDLLFLPINVIRQIVSEVDAEA